jgi:hypothetical protein
LRIAPYISKFKYSCRVFNLNTLPITYFNLVSLRIW